MRHPRLKTAAILLGLILVILVGFVLGRNSVDAPITTGSVLGQLKKLQLDLVAPPKDRTAVVDTEQAPVLIETPAANAYVANQFAVTGRAKASFSSVTILAKDSNGSLLATAEGVVTTDVDSVYGRFAVTVDVTNYQGALTLELIPKDDLTTVVRRQVIVGQAPVNPSANPNQLPISVFFSKNLASSTDCSLVTALSRTIDPAKNAYRQAIESLLFGPSKDELSAGYLTSIPKAVKIRSLTVDATGKVTVDFDSTIQKGVAGSCRVTAIRAQIEQTLKQFPEVHDVVITVRGDADNVLQP